MATLTKQQLLVLGAPGAGFTPQEELLTRVNLELQQHLALDIPATHANRALWKLVYDAQHQDPVY